MPKSTTRKLLAHGGLAAMLVGSALAAPASAASVNQDTLKHISNYCTASWRTARIHCDKWGDCTQDVLLRLLERIPLKRWERALGNETIERRELIRAIDAVKKRTQRARRHASLECDPPDRHEYRLGESGELRGIVLDAAKRSLTHRQYDILAMSLDGWTVPEIAASTNISTARVSDEKYKAIKKLQALLA